MLDYLTSYLGFLALFLAEKTAERVAEAQIPANEGFGNVITADPRMHETLDLVRKVASSDLTVLLRGETGTGKGILAYALHELSPRAERRFQAINCAAIPETLLESELFGHVRGAFTGADHDKAGLLVDAEGGTVFLDEIGKMPLSMQGKLLQFLDSKVVRPVGASDERQVDVRIVCASKSELQDLVQSDRFLEDLYFRLLDFPLVVPPLREREGDIPLLAGHFLRKYGGDDAPELGNDCLDALRQYHWPGNIRELEKCIQRALILARGRAAAASRAPAPASDAVPGRLGRSRRHAVARDPRLGRVARDRADPPVLRRQQGRHGESPADQLPQPAQEDPPLRNRRSDAGRWWQRDGGRPAVVRSPSSSDVVVHPSGVAVHRRCRQWFVAMRPPRGQESGLIGQDVPGQGFTKGQGAGVKRIARSRETSP